METCILLSRTRNWVTTGIGSERKPRADIKFYSKETLSLCCILPSRFYFRTLDLLNSIRDSKGLQKRYASPDLIIYPDFPRGK